MEWLIILVYGLTLFVICLFSLGQCNLAWHYLKAKKRGKEKTTALIEEHPFVTIQLPTYNERYVVERLINAVANMDYPLERFEIQVLDDSTDDTVQIIADKVAYYEQQGVDIRHVKRPDRVGFKAGALQHGMETAKGTFIAIFDSDFVPNPDFLLKTLSRFTHDRVGMVQTKWTHFNAHYGTLTKIQAFWLNAHFTVEQKGREQAGSFINFNGTAGIWRKECIEDAGGWQYDTLTEDLDLSYRAQLRGWEFVYSEEIETPAELPVVIPSVKSQQYRWNKGGAETARKTLWKVITSNLPLVHKTRAVFHLLNSSVFLLLLIAAILSIPTLYIKEHNADLEVLFDCGSIFLIGFFAISFFYWVAAKATHPEHTFWYYIIHFPMFLVFSMGMTLHNSVAVVEGYLGIKTPFVRTPKFNIKAKKDSWKNNQYLNQTMTPVTFMEGALAIYFMYGIFSGFKLEDYGLTLFHFMMAIGFAYVFLLSIKPIKHA